jgi:thioredoxin-related protein
MLTLAAFLLSGALQAATRDPATHFFQETFGDLGEELETAREEGKKGIVIFFELDDCPFCHRMKREVLNQPEVQDYYRKHFRIISMDIEGDVELVDFQGKQTTQKDFATNAQRVRATPVIAFFDLEGKRMARFIGATRDAKEFLLLGRFVAEGHYKNSNFTRFKRAQRKP